jgi:lysophospholipase L1-like esterase
MNCRRFLAAGAVAAACAMLPQRVAWANPNLAVASVSRMAEPWWRERFEAKQAELARVRPRIVWLGDSITQNWEKQGPERWRDFLPIWQQYYGSRGAVDLGFKGDSTCHLIWRLDHGELAAMHPRVIILLIGANNFGHVHTDASETFDGIRTILTRIHTSLPDTRVILIHVLPSRRSAWVDANTVSLNGMLSSRLAGLPWLDQLDASSIVMRNGQVDPDAFYDPLLRPPDPPLHPTAQVQAHLAQMIEPMLQRILAEPRR